MVLNPFTARRWPLGLALIVAGCQPSAPPVASSPPSATIAPTAPASLPPESAEFVVSVLGLNDLHGRLGALPAFAGYVEALRRKHGATGSVVVVDAGDMFQGTLGSNASEGRSVIEAYNALGMSVAAVGNHEFDYGPLNGESSGEGAAPQGALRRRIGEARFPVLSANLVESATQAPPAWKNLQKTALLRIGPVQLGFVGGLTEETPSIVRPDYFTGLSVAPLAPALEASARELRAQGADAVVALVHAGGQCKSTSAPHDTSSCDAETGEVFRLARALPKGLVDGIVGGHTHDRVAHYMNDTPIVEGLSRGKAFTRLDLRFDRAGHRLLGVRLFEPEPLCPDAAELAPCETHAYEGVAVSPNPAIAALIAPYLDAAQAERKRLLGAELAAEFPADHDIESALGNLFADAMRAQAPGSDVALNNGGGLRAKLPAGPLSYGALYEAMPFDNRLVTFEIGADELGRVLAAHFGRDAHGIVSVSGLRVTARCQGAKLELSLHRADGHAIRKTEKLRVVTSDYLATGGDRFFGEQGIDRARLRSVGDLLLRDALAAELAKRQRLDPHDPQLFDPKKPRLALPSPRPVVCR